jgi:hypothetical protein
MNPEFEQCLKRNKIREFPRGKALLTKTLGTAQRDLESAEKTLGFLTPHEVFGKLLH